MTETAPDFSWLFIQMLLGLLLVLGLAMVFIRYVIPRTRLGRLAKSGWARVLSRQPLDPSHHLYVVKIVERYFVIASSSHSIATVTELTQDEGRKIEQGT